VDPRASLDDLEKILDPIATRTPTPQSSSCSQSLYRLCYPETKYILQHGWKRILLYLYEVEIWPVTEKLQSKIRLIDFENS
jgi:hypothetical protein